MTFLLLWLPAAEQELRELLSDPDHRDSVVRAADAREQDLGRDAPGVGESRPKGRRVHFEPPLGVTYRVDSRNRIVRILHVWRISAAIGDTVEPPARTSATAPGEPAAPRVAPDGAASRRSQRRKQGSNRR